MLAEAEDFLTRTPISFAKNQEFNLDDDLCYLVLEGVVKIESSDEDGGLVCLGVYSREAIVSAKIFGLDWGKVVWLKPGMMVEVDSRSPQMMQYTTESLQRLGKLVYCLHYHDVKKRLWEVLKWLAFNVGVVTNDGVILDFKLTHESIGALAGTTRVTTTKVIGELTKAGRLDRLKKSQLLIRC